MFTALRIHRPLPPGITRWPCRLGEPGQLCLSQLEGPDRRQPDTSPAPVVSHQCSHLPAQLKCLDLPLPPVLGLPRCHVCSATARALGWASFSFQGIRRRRRLPCRSRCTWTPPHTPCGSKMCWLGEGTKGRSPTTKLSPDQAELGGPRPSRAQDARPRGTWFPAWPPRGAHTRWPMPAAGQGARLLGSECVGGGGVYTSPHQAHQLGPPPRPPRGPALPPPAALQLVEQRDDLSCPSAAQRVAQGHRTPQRVHLLRGQLQLLHTVDDLEGG